MLDTIRSIILDLQELDLKTGVPRRLEITSVPGKATILIGVRRSGKSTCLFQIMDRLKKDGVRRENILYLDFFDDRLHDLHQGDLGRITEAYYSLYPTKKNTETVYCFFDEIQMLEGWEPFVDRLLRTEQCEIYLTGSSSKMLSREIATQMRGRAVSWELFPFSFREFLDFKGIVVDGPLSTAKRLMVQKAFDEYFETGGFPEVAGLSSRIRLRIHQEYFQAILFRDLVERYDVSHPRAISDLAHRLMDNVASLYSVNSLTAYLRSLGHKIPKTSVSDYLQWFEDAHFLFTVRLYDTSLTRSNANPKKIYCVDHGLVTSTSSGILVNSGHLLENLVFVSLRRMTSSIGYFKTEKAGEVDFVARRADRSLMLVQVCESLANPGTRKREIRSLDQAMTELGLGSSFIVTRNQQEDVDVGGRRVKIVPAWRFLLDLQREIQGKAEAGSARS